MQAITDGVHLAEAPQRFGGIEVGARMTILETDRGLLVHSPLDVDPARVEAMGAIAWVVAPNKLHHLYAGRWIAAGHPVWAAPGLPEKRPDLSFEGVITGEDPAFGPDVQAFPLACFPMANEVVFLHRPTGTLVVTDLVFHFTREAPWLTRAAMTLLGGYPGCRTTVLEKVAFDRPTARREVAMLLDQPWDRLIMAHGAIVDSGGKEAFRHALGWLGLEG
jgi:hypothetical protein